MKENTCVRKMNSNEQSKTFNRITIRIMTTKNNARQSSIIYGPRSLHRKKIFTNTNLIKTGVKKYRMNTWYSFLIELVFVLLQKIGFMVCSIIGAALFSPIIFSFTLTAGDAVSSSLIEFFIAISLLKTVYLKSFYDIQTIITGSCRLSNQAMENWMSEMLFRQILARCMVWIDWYCGLGYVIFSC